MGDKLADGDSKRNITHQENTFQVNIESKVLVKGYVLNNGKMLSKEKDQKDFKIRSQLGRKLN